MNRDLNSVNGRILAARNSIWRNHLMDRRYLHTSDDNQEVDFLPVYPFYINNA